MKKVLTMVLALVMAVSLCLVSVACSKTEEAAKTEEPAKAAEPAKAEEPAKAAEPLMNYEKPASNGGDIFHGDPAQYTDGSLERTVKAGVLNVGAEGNWSPYIYNDTNQNMKLVGIEVEMADDISAILGVTNEWFVSSQWDGTLAGMDAGRYDSVYCGMSPGNDAYWGKYAFTRPYMADDTVLVVAADSDIDEWTDLAGKGCANSLTSGYGIIVREFGAETVPSQSMAQAIEMLCTGRADGHIQGNNAVAAFLNEKPDYANKIKIACVYQYEDWTKTWFCGSYRVADESLCAASSMAIDTMLQDGTVYDILCRYLGQSVADNDAFIVK